ncbi:MAG: transposase [Bacteroidales bacterium]|nr:transposase [Bacteroidales bacterium]
MGNPEGIYFIPSAIINWIDVFVREEYFAVMADSLNYCIENKGRILHGYCIMPSHIHLIFKDANNKPSKLLKEFKTCTSKQLKKEIEANPQESRKEWLMDMMKEAGLKNSNVKSHQFWQQHNHPTELWSNYVIDQKLDYLHNNPVEAGFVDEPVHWKYSSARDYAKIKSYIKVELIE